MRPYRVLAILAISLGLVGCASSPKKPAPVDNEKNPQYQYQLAVTAERYGLVEEAVKYLTRAIALDPAHLPSYFMLGNIRLQQGNYADAAQALEKCLELKPDYPEASARLGFAYEQLGFADKAEGQYRKAYALNPSVEACLSLAKILYGQKKSEEALAYAQQAVQKDSRSAGAYNLQGVILNELRRYPEAIQSFQNILKIDPANIVAGINLAVAYINNSELAEARALLEKLLPLAKEPELRAKISEILDKIKEN